MLRGIGLYTRTLPSAEIGEAFRCDMFYKAALDPPSSDRTCLALDIRFSACSLSYGDRRVLEPLTLTLTERRIGVLLRAADQRPAAADKRHGNRQRHRHGG